MWFFWMLLAAILTVYTSFAGVLLLFFAGADLAFLTMIVGFGGAFYCGHKSETGL